MYESARSNRVRRMKEMKEKTTEILGLNNHLYIKTWMRS